MAMTNGAAVERTARNVTRGARKAVRRAARVVNEAADETASAVNGGVSGAMDTMEDALSWAGGKLSALGDRIQEKPLQTAAIAVAAGAAIAWLMRR